MKLNNYRVYGLNIESEIEIEELKKLNLLTGDVDVRYITGNMPGKIKALKNNGKYIYYAINEVWFYINGVGSFYITNGNNVLIETDVNTNKQLIN